MNYIVLKATLSSERLDLSQVLSPPVRDIRQHFSLAGVCGGNTRRKLVLFKSISSCPYHYTNKKSVARRAYYLLGKVWRQSKFYNIISRRQTTLSVSGRKLKMKNRRTRYICGCKRQSSYIES
jgi:hypothetical protein